MSVNIIIEQQNTQINPLAPAPHLFQDYIGLHLLTLYAKVVCISGPFKTNAHLK